MGAEFPIYLADLKKPIRDAVVLFLGYKDTSRLDNLRLAVLERSDFEEREPWAA